MPELIYKIREHLTFDIDDERDDFTRQTTLFQILIDGLNSRDALLSTSFYELSKTFLSFKFQQTEGGRNYSYYLYNYPVPNTPPIQQFRKRIWDTVESNFKIYKNKSFDLLQSYSTVNPDVSEDIMKYDIPLLLNIIEKHLSPNHFEHCRYVQNQIRWCKRNSVSHPLFIELVNEFTNPTYQTFLKIDWDRSRDKEMYDFDDHREYERLKESEIRSSFVFKNKEEVQEFYNTFTYLKKTAENDWNYITTFDIIIDENYLNNFNSGSQLLIEVIKKNNEIDYIPRIFFRNYLKTEENARHIWSVLQNHEFANKSRWELSFYDNLEDSLLNENYAKALVSTVRNIKEANTIYFDRIQRFLAIEPNLFQTILRIIVDKNEKEKIQIQIWMDFFNIHFDQLGDDMELIKKAYLQQDKIHDHFDYQGKGCVNILKKDATFLIDYINNLYSVNQLGLFQSMKNLRFVWEVENIETVLKEVFDLITANEPYLGISKHFCNSFFKNLQGEARERAKNFLIDYCKSNFADSKKMNVVVDIVRNSIGEMFDEILMLFLSLSQDRDIFSKIWWRGNGGTYSGDVIIADIEMADWRNILSIIEKSLVGIKLIPIKAYLNEKIEYCLKKGDWERQRRFLKHY